MPAEARTTRTDGAARAIAWRHRTHALVCDVIEPWAHGTAVLCTSHPGFWDFNTLRLERPRGDLEPRALAALADELQDGLRHRRIEVEDPELGARLRPGFDELGWATERLVWLALEGAPPAGPDFDEVPVPATRELRLEWARSEPWGIPEPELQRQADAEEAVARLRGTRALIAREEPGGPIGFVLFETGGEVDQAYVTPSRRGHGLGGALVAAAARAAGGRDTFIVADDEGDPKRLYERLGFRPVWIQHMFTRRPE